MGPPLLRVMTALNLRLGQAEESGQQRCNRAQSWESAITNFPPPPRHSVFWEGTLGLEKCLLETMVAPSEQKKQTKKKKKRKKEYLLKFYLPKGRWSVHKESKQSIRVEERRWSRVGGMRWPGLCWIILCNLWTEGYWPFDRHSVLKHFFSLGKIIFLIMNILFFLFDTLKIKLFSHNLRLHLNLALSGW